MTKIDGMNTPEARKRRKRIVAISGIALLVIATCIIVFLQHRVHQYDVFADDYFSIEATGYDGEGFLTEETFLRLGLKTYDNTEVRPFLHQYFSYNDASNNPRSQFVESASFDVSKTHHLSNGDKITVTLNYDKDLAEQARIAIVRESKEFTITGLVERLNSSEDISDEDMEVIKDAFKARVKEHLNDRSTFDKFEAFYLAKDKHSTEVSGYQIYEDAIIAIYSYEELDFWDSSKSEKEYGYVAITGVNRETNYKDSLDKYSTISDLEWDGIQDFIVESYYVGDTLKEAKKSMNDKFNDYTITEFTA